MAYLRKQGGTAKNISPLRPVVSGAGAFYTKKGVHTLEQVKILDTTLRDGEQTPGVSFQLKEKVEIARALEDLGVDVIEAGFAASSKGDFKAISAISDTVRGSVICSLARCVPGDIDAAAQALASAAQKRIHVFIATSPIHMEYKLHMTPEDVYASAVRSVKQARNLCEDVEFSLEDATRSDREFIYRVVEGAIQAGATTINLPDTVGYAAVAEYGDLIRDVREHVPGADQVILSVHCHNDLGLAVANSLEGIQMCIRDSCGEHRMFYIHHKVSPRHQGAMYQPVNCRQILQIMQGQVRYHAVPGGLRVSIVLDSAHRVSDARVTIALPGYRKHPFAYISVSYTHLNWVKYAPGVMPSSQLAGVLRKFI